MGNVGRLVIGAAAIGAAFIPGVGPLVSTALLGFGISSVTGAGIAALTSRDVEREYENTATTTRPFIIPYGQIKVGGNVIEAKTDDDGNPLFLDVAFAVASEDGSGIEDVVGIYVDEILAVSTGSDFYGTGPVFRNPTEDNLGLAIGPDDNPYGAAPGIKKFFNSVLWYALFDGSDDQDAPQFLLENLPNRWNNFMEGVGIAHAAFWLIHDTTAFPGVPNITFEIKGNRVWDPRSASWAWSDNPALCLLDYLTSARYGLDVHYPERDADGTFSEIDEQSFIDAANYCDELVSVPDGAGSSTTQKRFTANVAIPTGDHKKAIQTLKSCMRGELVYQGGKYRLVIRKPTAPVDLILDEDNIIGDWEWTKAGTEKAPNTVRASFVNANAEYQADEVVWPRRDESNPYLTADNDFPSEMELDLRGVTDFYRAQQIAMTALKEARADISVQVTCTEAALQLQVGDVVRVTHNTPGWVERRFWVAAVGINGQTERGLTVRLALQEYRGSAYVLEVQDDEPDKPGDEPDRLPLRGAMAQPVGYWTFDTTPPPGGISGSNDTDARTVHDLSGYDNDAVIGKSIGFSWGAIKGVPGIHGRAMDNGGGAGSLLIQGSHSATELQLENSAAGFTFTGWWNETSGSQQHVKFGNYDTGNSEGFKIGTNNAGTQATFTWFDTTGTSRTSTVDLSPSFSDNTLHFYALVIGQSSDGTATISHYIDGRFAGGAEVSNMPVQAATTSKDIGFAVDFGGDANNVRFVGIMDELAIFEEALRPADIRTLFQNPGVLKTGTPWEDFDDVPDGDDFEKTGEEWVDNGRPTSYIDKINIHIDRNPDCANGSGLRVDAQPQFSSLTATDEGDWRIYLDWYEDGVHVKQDTTTDIWNISGGVVQHRYTDGTTGSDAGDATSHTISVRMTLVDITGTNDLAVDSKWASITATYGTC